MEPLREAATLSVAIARSPHDVYAFVANPANVPRWATGLGAAVECGDDECVAQTPRGPVRFHFTAANPFGVLDHYVSPAPGVEIYVPMRVVANGEGSEVLFTLFRQPGMSAAQFHHDMDWVRRDLQALKQVLEGTGSGAADV